MHGRGGTAYKMLTLMQFQANKMMMTMIGDDDNNNRSFDSIRYICEECEMEKKMRIDEWMSKSESNIEIK